jgi:hypothetical protein
VIQLVSTKDNVEDLRSFTSELNIMFQHYIYGDQDQSSNCSGYDSLPIFQETLYSAVVLDQK